MRSGHFADQRREYVITENQLSAELHCLGLIASEAAAGVAVSVASGVTPSGRLSL